MAQAAAAEPQDQFVLIVINVQNIKFTQAINLTITESDRHGARNDFYLFGCAGSSLQHAGSSLQHAGSSEAACGFSSCGRRVQ